MSPNKAAQGQISLQTTGLNELLDASTAAEVYVPKTLSELMT
jgi:hypothetical protein